MISNTSKVLMPATTDGSRSPISSTSAGSLARQPAEATHALRVGHRLLFLCRHRLGEIRPRRNETEQEQPVIHSAARVAGCMAISPNPLRRLHIAASSEYAFSPSSSVNSGAYDSHTCLAPTCALGSPVQYQCRSSPPSPQPRRSYSVIQVLRISDPSGRSTHSWVRRIG